MFKVLEKSFHCCPRFVFPSCTDAISALFYLHKSTIDFIKFESEKRRTKVFKPTKKNPQSSRHTIHFRKKLLFARRFFPLFQGCERKLLRRRKSVFTFVPAEPHTEWSWKVGKMFSYPLACSGLRSSWLNAGKNYFPLSIDCSLFQLPSSAPKLRKKYQIRRTEPKKFCNLFPTIAIAIRFFCYFFALSKMQCTTKFQLFFTFSYFALSFCALSALTCNFFYLFAANFYTFVWFNEKLK